MSLYITGCIWGTTSLHHRISGISLFRAMMLRHVRTDYSYYKINKRQSYFVFSGSRSSYKHWIQENVPIACLGNREVIQPFTHHIFYCEVHQVNRVFCSPLLGWCSFTVKSSSPQSLCWPQTANLKNAIIFFDIPRSLCALVGLVIKKMRD